MTHPTTPDEPLEPADIFFTRGRGLLSRLIRFFSRGFGESRTQVNHVGVVVTAATVKDAYVVEALTRVKRHRLWEQYGGRWNRNEVAVYRPTDATPEEQATIVTAAERYVGRRYGYLKILAHFLDWLLLGAYLFRRIVSMDRYPICSWVVAHAYGKTGRHFGVAPGAASPDDIWDYVVAHPQKYRCARALSPLRN